VFYSIFFNGKKSRFFCEKQWGDVTYCKRNSGVFVRGKYDSVSEEDVEERIYEMNKGMAKQSLVTPLRCPRYIQCSENVNKRTLGIS